MGTTVRPQMPGASAGGNVGGGIWNMPESEAAGFVGRWPVSVGAKGACSAVPHDATTRVASTAAQERLSMVGKARFSRILDQDSAKSRWRRGRAIGVWRYRCDVEASRRTEGFVALVAAI